MGHLRRGDIGGMSAVDPIATDLLHYASGRKGPLATFRSAENSEPFRRRPNVKPVADPHFAA